MTRSQSNNIRFILTIIILVFNMVFTDQHFQSNQPSQSTVSDNPGSQRKTTHLQDSFIQWRDYSMNNYPETYHSLDRSLTFNSNFPRENLKINLPPEVLQSQVPPLYEQSQFREINSRSEYQEHAVLNYPTDQLERGRSDIDPTEDDYGELGYSYPRPWEPLALPKFTPPGDSFNKEVPTDDPTTVGGKEEEVTQIMTITETTVVPTKSKS